MLITVQPNPSWQLSLAQLSPSLTISYLLPTFLMSLAPLCSSLFITFCGPLCFEFIHLPTFYSFPDSIIEKFIKLAIFGHGKSNPRIYISLFEANSWGFVCISHLLRCDKFVLLLIFVNIC